MKIHLEMSPVKWRSFSPEVMSKVGHQQTTTEHNKAQYIFE